MPGGGGLGCWAEGLCLLLFERARLMAGQGERGSSRYPL